MSACYYRVAHSILTNTESHWDTESQVKPLEKMRPPGKKVGTEERKWPRIKTRGPALHNRQAQKNVLVKEKEEDPGVWKDNQENMEPQRPRRERCD